ncbi:MAG: Vitamin B12 dependent methionine synthase, activation domain [Syntrophus sp. PtaB.Bin001]|nr:MAG: Vitamin B12 dependent methionine synthase, activation domain [Syntrophus sp. PtaB.Bin001]
MAVIREPFSSPPFQSDFETIRIDLPREQIYRRLGYRRNATIISPRQTEEIERYMEEAQSLISLKGTFLRLPIREISEDRVVLEGDVIFASRNLARFLKQCREAALMGATAGPAIMAAISEDAAGRNVTRAVVMDATASETTDAALDWIMSYLGNSLRREGRILLNRRYSAGYGDFLLENQRTLYRLLQLERFGVTLTDSCLLVPEKSVTAITGIIKAGSGGKSDSL